MASRHNYVEALARAEAAQKRLREEADGTSYFSGVPQVGESQQMREIGAGGELAKLREDPKINAALVKRSQDLAYFNQNFPFPGAMQGPVA